MGVAYTDAGLTKGPIYPAVSLLHCAGCLIKGELPVPAIFQNVWAILNDISLYIKYQNVIIYSIYGFINRWKSLSIDCLGSFKDFLLPFMIVWTLMEEPDPRFTADPKRLSCFWFLTRWNWGFIFRCWCLVVLDMLKHRWGRFIGCCLLSFSFHFWNLEHRDFSPLCSSCFFSEEGELSWHTWPWAWWVISFDSWRWGRDLNFI